ncbi:MAG: OsmC family protein [bacterium]|nr:OsmC family protein [bacterium]
MPVRSASAQWNGDLTSGNGRMRMESGAWEGPYSFGSRFAEEQGTNPEELIAAAHAGCFSMALSGELVGAGFTPKRVETTAKVHVDKVGDGFTITRVELETLAIVPGIEEKRFQEIVVGAKNGCPVSRLLTGAEITADARLVNGAEG